MKIDKKKEIKEDFCSACLVAPLAFSGIGASIYSEKTNKKSYKKTIFIIGVIVSVISILLGIYYLKNKKSCLSCTL